MVGGGGRHKYAHRGGDGVLTEFSDADNQLIVLATARGMPAVRVYLELSSTTQIGHLYIRTGD